jgi:hypothetical protein
MKKSEFEGIVDRTFGNLKLNYGLKKVETSFRQGGVTVSFENKTTRVLLNYEIGEEPWLTMIELENDKNKSTLGWLLVELGVQKAPTPEQAFHPKLLAATDLEPTLLQMNQNLQKYGAEILRGNFSIFPKLQDRSRKYGQDCKRYATLHKMKL